MTFVTSVLFVYQLAPSGEDDDAPPGNLAAALGSQAVLLDQLMLEPPDVSGLRREFDRFSEGHDFVNGVVNFAYAGSSSFC